MGHEKQTEKARLVREARTKKNDTLLLEHIKENPYITSVELEVVLERLYPNTSQKFRRSYLINALKRLEEKKLITWRQAVRERKFIKLYYLNFGQEKKKPEILEVPRQSIKYPEQWQRQAYLYAKANNVIKISSTENQQLKEESIANEPIPIIHVDETVRFLLPKHIVKFYNLDPRNYELEFTDEVISVTINPEIEKLSSVLHPNKTVLIMEDDPDWGRNLRDIIESKGHTVIVAENKEDAIKIFDQERIDYVILDWDINGKKVAEDTFRDMRQKNKRVPGSIITAYPISDRQWNQFTTEGFWNILKKHRGLQNEFEEITEIATKELARMETI
jgi:CheY-like chemotaxis protein